MAVQPHATTSHFPMLRRALQANGVFSAISGVVLAVLPAQVSSFLGVDMQGLINFLGAGLIGFAVALFWLASEPRIRRGLALIVILLDFVWVVDSILLLTTDMVPLTTHGSWVIAITSGIVTVFALLQSYGLHRSHHAS